MLPGRKEREDEIKRITEELKAIVAAGNASTSSAPSTTDSTNKSSDTGTGSKPMSKGAHDGEKSEKKRNRTSKKDEEDSSSSSSSSGSNSDSSSSSGSSSSDSDSESSSSSNSKPKSKKSKSAAASSESKLPVTQYVLFDNQHSSAVSTCNFHPNGTKIITGSWDYSFSVQGIQSSGAIPRKIVPLEGSIVVSAEFNLSGRLILAASSYAKMRLYNHEDFSIEMITGHGDPYILDMSKTKGHVSAVTRAVWSPNHENIFLSSSTDGTCRIWDVNADRSRNLAAELHSLEVFRARSEKNTRISVLTCSFSYASSGGLFCGACNDGSLQIWKRNGAKVRPDLIARQGAHENGTETSSVSFSPTNENLMVSRGGDGTVILWDIRQFTKGPIKRCVNLENPNSHTSAIFSPDGKFIVTGGMITNSSTYNIPGLHFFDIHSSFASEDEDWKPMISVPVPTRGSTSIDQIATSSGSSLASSSSSAATRNRMALSAISIAWTSKKNKIAVGCSNGDVVLFY